MQGAPEGPCRRGLAAALLDGLHQDLHGSWGACNRGHPEHPLVAGVHHRGDAVAWRQDHEDHFGPQAHLKNT